MYSLVCICRLEGWAACPRHGVSCLRYGQPHHARQAASAESDLGVEACSPLSAMVPIRKALALRQKGLPGGRPPCGQGTPNYVGLSTVFACHLV